MPWEETTWVDDDGSLLVGTPFDADHMNNIEAGIRELIDSLLGAGLGIVRLAESEPAATPRPSEFKSYVWLSFTGDEPEHAKDDDFLIKVEGSKVTAFLFRDGGAWVPLVETIEGPPGPPGADGEDGAPGAPGPPGEDGKDAVVTVVGGATVTDAAEIDFAADAPVGVAVTEPATGQAEVTISSEGGKGQQVSVTGKEPRPEGFDSVEWRGPNEPENAINGDTWIKL